MTEETPNMTDGGAEPRAEDNSAGADLDTLLAQYDEPKAPAPKPKPDLSELKPVIDFARQELEEKANERVQTDVKSAVDFVKEADEAKEMPDRLVRGFLEGYASENESFKNAFFNRQRDPKSWSAALEGVRSEFVEEIKGLPSNTVKSDAEAARAAVAGDVEPEGDQELDPVELMNMSEQDYQALLAKEIAKTER